MQANNRKKNAGQILYSSRVDAKTEMIHVKYQLGEKPKLWQKHKQHLASFFTVLFLLAINTCQQPFTLLS